MSKLIDTIELNGDIINIYYHELQDPSKKTGIISWQQRNEIGYSNGYNNNTKSATEIIPKFIILGNETIDIDTKIEIYKHLVEESNKRNNRL